MTAAICVFGAITAAIPHTTGASSSLGIFGLLFGIESIMITPIIGFVGGLIQGVIVAALYNFLAPRMGGIKLRFKEDSYAPPPP